MKSVSLQPPLPKLSICLYPSVSIHVTTSIYISICLYRYMKSVLPQLPFTQSLYLSLSIYIDSSNYIYLYIYMSLSIYEECLTSTPFCTICLIYFYLSILIHLIISIYISICLLLYMKSVLLRPPFAQSLHLSLSIYIYPSNYIYIYSYMS